MIKKTFNVTAAADGTVTVNEKPYFNKLECGVTKLKFTLPDMEGFAYLLARHDRRAYYAIPIDSNGEIMMGTTVTQYHGRWAFNVCITTTEITADDRKDSAVYMSDTFEGLVYDNIADADQPATGEPNTIKLANDLSFILAQARSEQQAINQRYSSVETLARQVADNAADVSAAELRAKASEDAAALSAADAHDSMVSAAGSAEDAERFAQDANMHAEVANAASASAREAADEANADLAAVEQLKDQAVQEAMEAARAAAGPAAEEAVAGVAAEVKEELDETVAQAKTDLETFVSESETQLQHYSDYSEQQANNASGSALAAMRSAQSAGQSVYNCSEQVNYARIAVTEAQEHAQAAYGSSSAASNSAENANASALAAAGSASDAAASATEIAGIYGPLAARVTTLEDNENNVILLSSADDLDDIVDITKKYSIVYGSWPKNSPATNASYMLTVEYNGRNTEASRRQIACKKNSTVRYERYYTGSEWSEWVTYDSKSITGGNDWSATTAYTVGQRVNYNNALYRCAVANTGQKPSDSTTYWTKVTLTTLNTDIVNLQGDLLKHKTVTGTTDGNGLIGLGVDKSRVYAAFIASNTGTDGKYVITPAASSNTYVRIVSAVSGANVANYGITINVLYI